METPATPGKPKLQSSELITPLTSESTPIIPFDDGNHTTLTPILQSISISTPRSCKQTSFTNFVLTGETSTRRQEETIRTNFSKTANVFQKMLPDFEDLPRQYADIKSKYRDKPHLNKDQFERIKAEISVKLQIKYNNWWDELSQLELSNNTTNSKIVTSDTEFKHKNLMRNLALCKQLKKCFNLKDP